MIKKFLVVVCILCAIILIIFSCVKANKDKGENELLNATNEKIMNINSGVFQNKIIDVIKKSSSNIDDDMYKTDYIVNEEGYVVEIISDGRDLVEIPLFKIKKDNEGKFKSIVYFSSGGLCTGKNVSSAVEEVLAKEYDIQISNCESNIYNQSYTKSLVESRYCLCSDEKFANDVFKKLVGENQSNLADVTDNESTQLYMENCTVYASEFGLIK